MKQQNRLCNLCILKEECPTYRETKPKYKLQSKQDEELQKYFQPENTRERGDFGR